jgi:hypothetical protein
MLGIAFGERFKGKSKGESSLISLIINEFNSWIDWGTSGMMKLTFLYGGMMSYFRGYAGY